MLFCMIVKYSFLPFLLICHYTPTVTFSPHSNMKSQLHVTLPKNQRSRDNLLYYLKVSTN